MKTIILNMFCFILKMIHILTVDFSYLYLLVISDEIKCITIMSNKNHPFMKPLDSKQWSQKTGATGKNTRIYNSYSFYSHNYEFLFIDKLWCLIIRVNRTSVNNEIHLHATILACRRYSIINSKTEMVYIFESKQFQHHEPNVLHCPKLFKMRKYF